MGDIRGGWRASKDALSLLFMCCHCPIHSLRNIGIAAILAGVLLVVTGSIVLAQQADDPDELSRRITELNAAARYAEALPLAQRRSAITIPPSPSR